MPKIIKMLITFDIFEPDIRVFKRITYKCEFLGQLISFSNLKLNLLKEVFTSQAIRNS